MKDKDYEVQRKRVLGYWDKWYKILAMHHYRIDRNWARERDEDVPHTLGSTTSNWQYQTASITFFLPEVMDNDDSMLEEAVVHEFVHVLISPLHDFRDDQARMLTEHTVTTLARSLVWSHEAGEKVKKNVSA